MLVMRLQRFGRKNSPSFRVVVVDSRRAAKSGKAVDTVGSYEPKSGAISLDAERVKTWLGNGAQASPTVHNMLITKGIIEGKKINVLPKKTPIVKEAPAEEAAAEAPAPAAEAETPAEPAPAAEEAPAPAEAETAEAKA